MATLNENMTIHQVRVSRQRNAPPTWGPIPEDVASAFLYRRYRIVTVKTGTKLWKMTQWPFNPSSVTPWWSSVLPYEEDWKGVSGNLREAAFNGVPAATYIRIASAVRFDWNRLSMLQQITLKTDAKGLWGQFAPQPSLSVGRGDLEGELKKESPHIPLSIDAKGDVVVAGGLALGGLGAWQFWIPNLTGESANHDFSESNADAWVRRLGVHLPQAHPFVR